MNLFKRLNYTQTNYFKSFLLILIISPYNYITTTQIHSLVISEHMFNKDCFVLFWTASINSKELIKEIILKMKRLKYSNRGVKN